MDINEDFRQKLDAAMASKAALKCVLRGEGLTETRYIDTPGAQLFKKIIFRPYFFCDGYYSGYMFYPGDKPQGEMDFEVESFISIKLLAVEE